LLEDQRHTGCGLAEIGPRPGQVNLSFRKCGHGRRRNREPRSNPRRPIKEQDARETLHGVVPAHVGNY